MNLLSDIVHIMANISWGADIAATIAALLIGLAWYSSGMFGNIWAQETGIKKDACEKGGMACFWYIPVNFIIAANIAAFCKHFDYDSPIKAFLIGYDLGLIASLLLALLYLREGKSLALFGINAGYIMLSTSIMGIIIGFIL